MGGRGPAGHGLRWLIAVVLAAALLAWLLHDAPLAALLGAAAALPPWTWVAAAAGMVGTYVLRALRMRNEWSAVRPAGVAECLRIVLAHNVGLMLLPMRGGELGYVWLVQRHWGTGYADAAASLVWWRMQDAFVLALLGVALLPPWPAPVRVAMAASLLVVGTTALPALLRAGRRRSPRLERLASVLVAHRGDLGGWVYCTASWTLKLVVIGSLFALLAGLDADAALRGAIGGELAGAIPVQGPAGLGTYELGAWAGARLEGASGTRLAAAALLVHVFCIAVAVLAAAAVHARPPARAAAASAQP